MHIIEVGEWVIGSAGLIAGTTALGLALALPLRLRRYLPTAKPPDCDVWTMPDAETMALVHRVNAKIRASCVDRASGS